MENINIENIDNNELLQVNKIVDEYISYLENLLSSIEEKSDDDE